MLVDVVEARSTTIVTCHFQQSQLTGTYDELA